MPDFKFWSKDISEKTCDAPGYPDIARKAILEMHRQVGPLVINAAGIAERGLLVRHLIMPGDLAGTSSVMKFLAKEVSEKTYVNIMPQYRPCGRSHEIPGIHRSITMDEYNLAISSARKAGITRLNQR